MAKNPGIISNSCINSIFLLFATEKRKDHNTMDGIAGAEMLGTFKERLKTDCHCSPDSRFLIALSGGIDSTVMAWLFQMTGLDFAMAHCNFHLRGTESDGDQQFVEDLAQSMKAFLYVQHFQTAEYAKSNGISLQMAARDLRYRWFEDIRQNQGFTYVAIAHNRDDHIETVMLNLSRGTGIRGLTGIKPRQGYVIRPLLFASREDIRSFAVSNRIKWRDDSSNAHTKYHRNAIRHDIIPRLEEIYPAFRKNVLHTSNCLDQVSQLLDWTMEEIRKTICTKLPDRWLIDVEKLMEYPAVETVLYELLKDFGCNASMVRSIHALVSGIPGKRILTGSHTITRDRQYLIITENATAHNEMYVIEKETVSIEHPIRLNFNLSNERKESFVIPTSRRIAALDADQVVYPIILRRWKHGDHFRPLGMDGNKKISDFLIDQKIPLPDKQQTWVMVSGDQILWLVDHRIDDRFKIRKHTRRILLIEHLEESDYGKA